MLRPQVRSTLSALVTACFALSAITWGRMPGCANGTGTASPQVAHYGTPHQHPDHSGRLPATAQCFVHLCCLQLTAPSSATPLSARLSEPQRLTAELPATVFVPVRPAHVLPFAHAPPHPLV
jgi:hypothetical protein